MNANVENDPIRPLLDRKKPSAEIVTDERYGYDRVYPAEDVLAEMGDLYAKQIEDGDKAFEPRFRAMRAAEDAYEAEMASETENIITAPLGKTIINQQIAWITNQILSKDPYVTWKPLDGGDYEVPVQETGSVTPVSGAEGIPPLPMYDTETLASDDVARNLQDLLQYYLSAVEPFEETLENTVHAIHVGENPTYWRVDYDPSVLHAKTKNFQRDEASGLLRIMGVSDAELAPKSVVCLRHVSGYNITHSLPCSDIQKAWWVSEKTPRTNEELWEGISAGRYDFARKPTRRGTNDDLVRRVFAFGEDVRRDDPVAARADAMDSLVAEHPRDEHDVRTVSFFHPLLLRAPKRGEKTLEIEIRSLIGELHLKSRTWLNMTCNWSWSGKRLLIPFIRHRRPHRLTGMSAAGDVAPLQNLVSNFLHLQMQNKVQNAIKVHFYRENSATDRYFKQHPGPLRPGQRIPFDEPSDVNSVQLGAPIETLAPEIAVIRSMADDLLVRDETSVPNRTPGATVAQVYQRAKEQSVATMRGIRRSIAQAAMMYVETVAQFSAYAIIPFNDKDKRRTTSKIIGFPREVISQHFSCHVTATGDDDSSQARFEKAGLLAQRVELQNEADMKLLSIALDGEQPEAKRDVAKFMILRGNRLLAEQIRSYRLDTQHFVIDEKMLAELEQSLQEEAAQKAEEAAAMAAQGVTSGANVSPQGAPGSLPAAPPGQGPPGGVPGQPVPAGIPQPPQPGVGQQPAPPVQ